MKVIKITLSDLTLAQLGNPTNEALIASLLMATKDRLEKSVQERVQKIAKAQLAALPPPIVEIDPQT